MSGINKSFLAVKALQNVSLKVRPGEIHALLGENGAGKSTLIKILTGIYSMDSGEILFDGKKIAPKNALEAQKLGISTIYQELNLIPYLSIAENIFLGREPMKAGRIDWKKMRKDAKDILKNELGLDVDVTMELNECSTAIFQMTALARAISIDSKLVIMDEATSSLEEKEVSILFDAIHRLQAKGIAVIYISHKMDEIFEICDTATVLKDGQYVDCKPVKELTKLSLVSMMIGRDATDIVNFKKQYKDFSNEPVVCEAMRLRSGKKVKDVNFNVRAGEIVGLSGLLASGRTESVKILFGADPNGDGDITVNGQQVFFRLPKEAVAAGMGFCSEDRKREGIFPNMSIEDNMNVVLMPKVTKGGIVHDESIKGVVDDYIEKLAIQTPSRAQLIKNLSGGNQQKVLLARWMCIKPDILILDEPTRGIDVGAKAEIESLIQELSAQGVAVIYISSEWEELQRGCDRIVVLNDGNTVAELVGEEINEERLLKAMTTSRADLEKKEAV